MASVLAPPDRVATEAAAAPEALDAEIIEDARRHQRRRRGLLSAAALAAIVAATAGYILTGGGSTGRLSDPRPSSVPAVSRPRVLSGTPIQTASALGSVWVLTCERNCSTPPQKQGFGRLFRVNSHTGQIVARIAVTNPSAFAIGDGTLWIVDFYAGSVRRVDPRTGRTIQTISLPLLKRFGSDGRRFLPSNISAGRAAVWVASARGWLAQIAPRSGRVVSLVRAPFDATGHVVVGAHGTWVAESSLGVGVVRPGDSHLKLLAIKARSGQVAVDQLALGGGLVWAYGEIAASASRNGGGVLTNTARLITLDPRTGRIIHQLRFPAGPYEIAYGSGGLFAANFQTGRLFRIDTRYTVHALRPVRGPGTLIAVTPGAIWATTKSGVMRRIAVPTR
ncbi:MAG: hypothetical protein ACR2NR_19745 [Solirubrobacteraceae bacterium]